MNESNILIAYGSTEGIKSLEKKGDLVTVGDYGILWGSEKARDLGGDWFTPNTYLGARNGVGIDTMLHHGIPLSRELKEYSDILLPPTIKAEADDHGLLVATVLDMRDRYQRKMFELSEEGAFCWSSGANHRAVKRAGNVKAGEVLQWPLMEFSFTPTPAEPRMMGIAPLDSVKAASLEWLEEPSYTKAIRVLTDLKSADDKGSEASSGSAIKSETPHSTIEVKSALFSAYDGAEATVSVLRGAVDRLVYGVVYEALSGDMVMPQTVGLNTYTPPTTAERLKYLQDGLDGFGKLVYAVAEAILELRAEQEPEDAAKSLRQDYLNLKAASPEKQTFGEQSETVLAAVEGYVERVHDLIDMRSNSRKTSRVLSEYNYDQLNFRNSRLQELSGELAELLRIYDRDPSSANTPEAPEISATKSDQSERDLSAAELAAEMAAAELRFLEFEHTLTEL